MEHHFDIEIAEKTNVICAIIYHNLKFWITKNKANNKNFIEGNYWTYNSVKAWSELFPYLGQSQIRNALKKLEDDGYIKSGEYNTNKYDRTKWYCIVDLSFLANGVTQNNEPIPYNKQDNKQDTIMPNDISTSKKEYKSENDFTLKAVTKYSRVSEEYKEALDKYLNNYIDAQNQKIEDAGAKHRVLDFNSFMVGIEAKDWKYANFVKAYRSWNMKHIERVTSVR